MNIDGHPLGMAAVAPFMGDMGRLSAPATGPRAPGKTTGKTMEGIS